MIQAKNSPEVRLAIDADGKATLTHKGTPFADLGLLGQRYEFSCHEMVAKLTCYVPNAILDLKAVEPLIRDALGVRPDQELQMSQVELAAAPGGVLLRVNGKDIPLPLPEKRAEGSVLADA